MNKRTLFFEEVKDFLFRMGIIRKKCYIIRKDDLDSYVYKITETIDKTTFDFCNDKDDAFLFDDVNAACSYISVYNSSSFAADSSNDETFYHKCFLVPVEALHRSNKTTVNKIS